jgi:hypothetical protein
MNGYSNNLSTAYNPRGVRRGFPQNYGEALAQWNANFEARRKNPRRRRECKLANNTVLVQHADGRLAVRLHETDVVTFHGDGSATLNSGGWQTFTTRDRMTSCGFSVGLGGGVAVLYHGGRRWTYADGMRVKPDGTVSYVGFVNPDADAALKLRRRRLALVKRLEKKANALGVYVGDMLADMSPEQRAKCSAYHDAWYWPNRSGGQASGGNAPEAFEAA